MVHVLSSSSRTHRSFYSFVVTTLAQAIYMSVLDTSLLVSSLPLIVLLDLKILTLAISSLMICNDSFACLLLRFGFVQLIPQLIINYKLKVNPSDLFGMLASRIGPR